MKTNFTINGCATLLKKDRRTIEKAVRDAELQPVSKDNKDNDEYKIEEMVDALYNSKILNLTNERAELTHQQKLKAELEVQKLKGDLVPTVEVEDDATNVAVSFKTALGLVPAKVSAILANETDVRKIEQILEEHMRTAVNELARSMFVDDEMEDEVSE